MQATEDEIRSSRAVREEIENLALACKALIDAAKAGNRDLTKDEAERFDRIVDVEIPRLKREEKMALRAESDLLEQHGNRGDRTMQPLHLRTFDNPNVRETERLLAMAASRRPLAFGSVSSLRAFRSEQSAYDAGQWLRAIVARTHYGTCNESAESHCRANGLEIVNAGAEGSGPGGGYLVPAPISTAIIEIRERVGIARQVCNVMPSGETLTVPKRAGGLTVYAPGEGQAIADSDKSWGAVSLIVKKRAVLAYVSQELSDDALINVVDNLFTEMAYALALNEDNELINGDGTSTYFGVRGLLNRIGSAGVASAASGRDTWQEIDLADLAACVGKLPDRFFPYGPGWICSHSFFNQVMARLAFAAGGVTMAEVMTGSPNVRSFMGYPAYLTSQMPTSGAASTACALFGAFSQAVILADRGGIRLARSDEYKFPEDQVALRATSRYDLQVHESGSSSAAGAYVALETAS